MGLKMKVGDLVRVSDSHGLPFAIGVYLGVMTGWKEFHLIHHDGQAYRYDEPFWQLEVISES
jgi:hypothetical protein